MGVENMRNIVCNFNVEKWRKKNQSNNNWLTLKVFRSFKGSLRSLMMNDISWTWRTYFKLKLLHVCIYTMVYELKKWCSYMYTIVIKLYVQSKSLGGDWMIM